MTDQTMDWVFIAANAVVFPAWLLLILQPRNPWTATLVHAAFAPLILGALYITGLMIAILTDAMADGAGFLTLDAVMALFDSRLVALNGWIHYLAFDLFVGAWIARDAMRIGATYIVTALCLVATFLLGPLGLTIYLAYRWAGGHGTSLFEAPPAERAT